MQNSSEKKEYLRQYYLANKETIKAKHKEYYENNKDYLYQKSIEWKQANPEKVKAYRIDWSKNNPEKDKLSKQTWEKNNPQYTNAKNRKRRAIRMGVDYTPYTEAQVLEKYGSNCHLCKKPIDLSASRKGVKPGWEQGLHIDHVIPIANGGPDTIANVRPAHAICNLRKGARMSEEFEQELDESLFEENDTCDCLDECNCDDDFDDFDLDDDETDTTEEEEE